MVEEQAYPHDFPRSVCPRVRDEGLYADFVTQPSEYLQLLRGGRLALPHTITVRGRGVVLHSYAPSLVGGRSLTTLLYQAS